MAFSSVPTLIFGSTFTSTATNFTVPLSAFAELTSAEVNASTGDSRKIIYGMLERFYAYYNGLAAEDRPAKMTLSKTNSALNASNQVTTDYSARFIIGGSLDVVAE
jgi:hypothetical protein